MESTFTYLSSSIITHAANSGRGVLCRAVRNADLVYSLLVRVNGAVGKQQAIRYNYSLFTKLLQPSVEHYSTSSSNFQAEHL